MSNAVLTSYSQHIFFHDETSERISLIFFPDLFSVGSCSENSSLGADLFGSATVKKRDSARDVLSFRSFSKGCLPRYGSTAASLLYSTAYLCSTRSPTEAWSGPLLQRSDSNFPSAFPKTFHPAPSLFLAQQQTYPGAGLGGKCRGRSGRRDGFFDGGNPAGADLLVGTDEIVAGAARAGVAHVDCEHVASAVLARAARRHGGRRMA